MKMHLAGIAFGKWPRLHLRDININENLNYLNDCQEHFEDMKRWSDQSNDYGSAKRDVKYPKENQQKLDPGCSPVSLNHWNWTRKKREKVKPFCGRMRLHWERESCQEEAGRECSCKPQEPPSRIDICRSLDKYEEKQPSSAYAHHCNPLQEKEEISRQRNKRECMILNISN